MVSCCRSNFKHLQNCKAIGLPLGLQSTFCLWSWGGKTISASDSFLLRVFGLSGFAQNPFPKYLLSYFNHFGIFSRLGVHSHHNGTLLLKNVSLTGPGRMSAHVLGTPPQHLAGRFHRKASSMSSESQLTTPSTSRRRVRPPIGSSARWLGGCFGRSLPSVVGSCPHIVPGSSRSCQRGYGHYSLHR